MNIPWKVSELESVQVDATENPIPNGPTTFGPVDVRGWDWIEWTVLLENNVGGAPVTQLDATCEYNEGTGPLATHWARITSEDVDISGLAPQVDWQPQRTVSGATVVWRIPVPVHGQQMRLNVEANNTPDVTSTMKVFAYRRSF